MAEQFYTILTNTGKAKIANSLPTGQKLNLLKMKIGDSNGNYYNPSESQTDLVHKVYECNITSVEVDKDNPQWITITAAIPSDVGGFSIREVGVFDDSNSLIAIGKYPETYKPVAADGSTKELYIKMTLEVTNAASVALKIDPTVILATKKDVANIDTKIEQVNTQLSQSIKLHFIKMSYTGDCSLIKLNNDEYIIVDFGATEANTEIINYIASLGIIKIKYAILTHYHSDHCGNLKSFVSKYGIEKIYLPHTPDWTRFTSNSGDYSSVQSDIESFLTISNVEKIYPNESEIITLANCKFRFFNCSDNYFNNGVYYNELIYGTTWTDKTIYNNFSMCFEINYLGKIIYFASDLESAGQKQVLDDIKSCDVLKVPHHFFNWNENESFWRKIAPYYSIAMSNNVTPRQGLQLAKTYCNFIFNTAYSGNTVVTIGKGNIDCVSENGQISKEKMCDYKSLIGDDNTKTFEELLKIMPAGAYLDLNNFENKSWCPEPFKTYGSSLGYYSHIYKISDSTWSGYATLKNNSGYINGENTKPVRSTFYSFSAGIDNDIFTYEFTPLAIKENYKSLNNPLIIGSTTLALDYRKLNKLKLRFVSGVLTNFTEVNISYPNSGNNKIDYYISTTNITEAGLPRIYRAKYSIIYNSDYSITVTISMTQRVVFSATDGTFNSESKTDSATLGADTAWINLVGYYFAY